MLKTVSKSLLITSFMAAALLPSDARAVDATFLLKSERAIQCFAAMSYSRTLEGHQPWLYLTNLAHNVKTDGKQYQDKYIDEMMTRPKSEAAAKAQACLKEDPLTYLNVIPAEYDFSPDPYTRLTECYGALFIFHNDDKDDTKTSDGEKVLTNVQYAQYIYDAAGHSKGRENRASKYMSAIGEPLSQDKLNYCINLSLQLMQ